MSSPFFLLIAARSSKNEHYFSICQSSQTLFIKQLTTILCFLLTAFVFLYKLTPPHEFYCFLMPSNRVIDFQAETMMTLDQAAKLMPGRMGHVCVETIRQWAIQGRKNGIKLETIKIGGSRMTSREALVRFVCALNGDASQSQACRQSPGRRSPSGQSAVRAEIKALFGI